MSRSSFRPTRREFLAGAAAVAAAPYVIPASALGKDDRPAPSNRIVMGGIGLGNMGGNDLGMFLGRNEVQYVAVCDCRKNVREVFKRGINNHYHNTDCKDYGDFRDLLARPDIDAVHIATPDHWHAIMVIEACRHGKDVYCQKPESRTLREGALMVAAARRYGRVVSGGSQRVLEDYRGIVDQCWGGEKGKVKSINVNLGRLSQPCYLPAQPCPPEMDWDMWLGPAPWAPYHRFRCSGSFWIDGTSWRSFSDYSGGDMTDWGAHHFGGALFAVDVRELEPTDVIFHNEQGMQWLTYQFPNGIEVTHNRPGKGNLAVEFTGEKKEAKPVPTYKGDRGIYGDFLHCVKSREKPFRDIELASHCVTVCHLGSIAYQLQRSLKWDTVKKEFPGDEEANRLVDRARREPWVL